jgi:hypothetical protein
MHLLVKIPPKRFLYLYARRVWDFIAAVTQSAGTRFRLFSAEYGFTLAYAHYFRKNYDAKNKAERIARLRQELEFIRQQKGDPTPTTDTEIETRLQHAEDRLLREFFEKFFACVEIPDNKTRFDYTSMVRRAREAATLPYRDPSETDACE